jgi:hypothetical protein
MKRYRVHFRNKKNATYEAFSYSQKDGKFYFHKMEDESDTNSFVFEKDVMGIDELPPFEAGIPVSV